MKWLKYFVLTLFHPIDTFYLIKKDRKHIPIVTVLVLFAVAVALKILYVYTVNFTVATTSAANANAIIEIGIITVPIILWAVASYALMTVCGGESTFKETLTISAYSLAPYIVFTPIMIIISQVLTESENGFFVGMNAFIIAWMVILLFLGFMQSNGLSFGKAVGFALVSVVAMVIIAATVLLVFALGAQIVKFVQELADEIKFFLR